VYACRAKRTKFLRFECPWICFERNLGINRKRHARAHRGNNLLDTCCGEHARCPSAEKHGVDLAPPNERQSAFEIGNQRLDIARFGYRFPGLMGIEVAVWTFAHAPRDMDVERERGQRLERGCI